MPNVKISCSGQPTKKHETIWHAHCTSPDHPNQSVSARIVSAQNTGYSIKLARLANRQFGIFFTYPLTESDGSRWPMLCPKQELHRGSRRPERPFATFATVYNLVYLISIVASCSLVVLRYCGDIGKLRSRYRHRRNSRIRATMVV